MSLERSIARSNTAAPMDAETDPNLGGKYLACKSWGTKFGNACRGSSTMASTRSVGSSNYKLKKSRANCHDWQPVFATTSFNLDMPPPMLFSNICACILPCLGGGAKSVFVSLRPPGTDNDQVKQLK